MHANLIAIDGKGVLIAGPPGSGKTLLALHLMRRCRHAEIDAHWIADDQVILDAQDGALMGSCPDATRGKVEIRGFGIADLPTALIQNSNIALHVGLVPQSAMVRMWDGQSINILGIDINSLTLCADNAEAAGNAVLAMLGHPIWV